MGTLHFSVLFILGIGLFGGLLGASLFGRLRIPQVVGYIAIGLLIGQTGLKLVRPEQVEALRPFNMFALGIIGFLVGGELRLETFRKYGRQFLAMLLGEGLGAFVLVGVGTGLLAFCLVRQVAAAVAVGVVFGAIASATDPASTVTVLWEERSRGVLTTSLIAIVALDDALAMTLYALGTSVAQTLTSHAGSVTGEMMTTAMELIGALGLGAVSALVLTLILRWGGQPENLVAFAIGLVLLVISVALAAGMDVILAAMAFGAVTANLSPRRSRELFEMLRRFSLPIYTLFFVLVGARLSISSMPWWLCAVVGIYVLGRTTGKMAGAYLGARFTGAESPVRRYLGLGLFAQGGVAVGLSIMASQHLGHIPVADDLALGQVIIFGITATTLIVQIIGPPMVKLAVHLAGERGRDVREEDVIASWTVRDAMGKDITPIPECEPLSKVFQTFSESEHLVYPVVDRDGQLVGVLTLEGVKEVLADRDTWEWLLAVDVMMSVPETTRPETPLKDALDTMSRLGVDVMPVVEGTDGQRPVGVLDARAARRLVAAELLRRQQASSTTSAPAEVQGG